MNKGLKVLSRSPGQESPMEYRRPWIAHGSNTYSGSHVLLAGPTFITNVLFFSQNAKAETAGEGNTWEPTG